MLETLKRKLECNTILKKAQQRFPKKYAAKKGLREQVEKENTEQEQAAREQAERERAKQEQAAREKAEQEQAAKEQAEREKAEQKQVAKINFILKAISWLLFGVVASYIPIILGIIYDSISGYNFSEGQLDYCSDFLLAVVAVCANACNYAVFASNTGIVKRVLYIIFTVISIVFGIGLYSFLFRKANSDNILGIGLIFVVFIIILIACAAIGILIEIDEYRERIKDHG